MIRFVVSDVDGTLIYKNAHLNTTRFPVMLKKLDEQHIPFAVATGRHYAELKKLFGKSVENITCVCCHGAYSIKNDATISACAITHDTVKAVFDTLSSAGVAIVFHSIYESYIYNASPLLFSKESKRTDKLIRISDVDGITKDIFLISIYGNADGMLNVSGLRICYSSRGVVEYVNKRASKHEAITTICGASSVPLSDVLFFGDGENDSELLKSCGTSYTTYCADKKVFSLTNNHTRDVIGTTIRLADEWQKTKIKEATI